MLGRLLAAAALSSGVAYAALAPRSQLFGRTFCGEPGARWLALTYDDGPNDAATLPLLDLLAKHEVRATFLLIGRFAAQRPDIVRAIAAAGHDIGNHTWSHPALALCSEAETRCQIEDCQHVLEDTIGAPVRLFRPPFGARRPATLRIARELGLEPVMWSVTCYDWKPTTAGRVERHAVAQIRGGDIILLHDGWHGAMGADRAHTVAATERLIARYRAEGCQFVTTGSVLGRLTSPEVPEPDDRPRHEQDEHAANHGEH
jgi:peptidoglycan-N-acetylglucosamine deacetylase